MPHRNRRPARARRVPAVIESVEARLLFDASQLSATIVSSTLPATISDQGGAKGTVVVAVTNASGATQTLPGGVAQVYLSAGGFDPQSYANFFLGERHLPKRVASGAALTYAVSINIKKGQIGADGDYNLYPLVVDHDNQPGTFAAGPELDVTAPDVKLAVAQKLPKLPAAVGAKGSIKGVVDKLLITNSGTADSTTTLEVAVNADPTDDLNGVEGQGAGGLTKKVRVPAGKTVTVPVKLSGTFAAGTYALSAVVETLNNDATVYSSDNPTFTVVG